MPVERALLRRAPERIAGGKARSLFAPEAFSGIFNERGRLPGSHSVCNCTIVMTKINLSLIHI